MLVGHFRFSRIKRSMIKYDNQARERNAEWCAMESRAKQSRPWMDWGEISEISFLTRCIDQLNSNVWILVAWYRLIQGYIVESLKGDYVVTIWKDI